MTPLFFASSNPNKLQEYQKLLSPFEVNSLDLSLDEPQIENLKQLCEYKLKDAIKKTQPKVNLFVEDTALYFEEWRFFPGVFIKWMLQKFFAVLDLTCFFLQPISANVF